MKRLINRWLWMLTCAAAFSFAACSDSDTDDVPVQEAVPPTITAAGIPADGMHFLYSDTEARTFTLTVDAPWTITKNAGWFVVSPKSGKAGEEMVITVTPSFNETGARTGEVVVTANSGNNLKPCKTDYKFQLKQDAYLGAGLTVDGIEAEHLFPAESPAAVTLTVNATYDWKVEVSDVSWVTVAPKSGVANTPATVTVTPKANTEAVARESVLTFTCGDPNLADNSATKVITLRQEAFRLEDSHQPGFIFFQDDFQWIQQNWLSPYTKYGWPSVKIDGEHYNEFALGNSEAIVQAATGIGYTYSDKVYARYEGFVKFGNSSVMGWLQTPRLASIDAGKTAAVLVTFYGAGYSSAGGSVDIGDKTMHIEVIGEGTIGGEKSIAIEMTTVWEWQKYAFVVEDATCDTQIKFGCSDEKKGRMYLDMITVARVESGATAPAPELVTLPLEVDVEPNITPDILDGEMIAAAGGKIGCSIRVNRGWTATSSADWLKITKVATKNGSDGAKVANGEAVVPATGLPYNASEVTVEPNATTSPRTAVVTIKSDDGKKIFELPVAQAAAASEAPTIELEGLTDNALPEFAADATAAATFSVKANYDWTITVPEGDTWYTVAPLTGKANEKTTVSVTPTVNTDSSRSSELTITVGEATWKVLVSQASATNEMEGLPAIWCFNAERMAEYQESFEQHNEVVANQVGKGVLSFEFVNTNDPNGAQSRKVGGTGHPYITGAWPGDYWLFRVPVKNVAAGTKVKFSGLTRTSGTGHKYWMLEYNDGGEWKPAAEVKSATDVEGVTYTHAMDGTNNVDIAVTVTLSNAIADGNVEFRFRCMANWKAKGGGALGEPNGGTSRWAGKDENDSPRIEVVE